MAAKVLLSGFEKVNPIGQIDARPPYSPSKDEKKKACRNLFGAPAPGEVDDLLKREQAENLQKICNFVPTKSKCDKTDNSSQPTKRKNPEQITDYYSKRKYTNNLYSSEETLSLNNATIFALPSAPASDTVSASNSALVGDSNEFSTAHHQKSKKSQE